MAQEIVPLVVDNGSSEIRVGIAGDDLPRVVFPNILGQISNKRINEGTKNTFIGDELKNCGMLDNFTYPVNHGIITDWDDMEKIWNHAFHERLKIHPAEHTILFTEPLVNPKKQREKIAEIMFEKFNVPGIAFEIAPTLTLYTSGHTTGTVLECGDGLTSSISVYEGYAVKESISRYDYGGRELTEYLIKLLNENSNSYSHSDFNAIKVAKEKLAYVALDYKKELFAAEASNTIEETYKLPNDQIVTMNIERFKCAEALFDPSMIGLSAPGVHEIAYNSIMKSHQDFRSKLLSNFIISGGSILLPGFVERLKTEISRLGYITEPVLYDTFEAWTGGSIVASVVSSNYWVTKRMYDECEKGILHRRFYSH